MTRIKIASLVAQTGTDIPLEIVMTGRRKPEVKPALPISGTGALAIAGEK
ncbi:MAG: hypothetical protein N838_18975 [Thiohalocapsa sp. PB-PSB1]|jgi:hypothetical protein|nr:MAG: hypothetical protein N838_18975 [Thiohalocapsa sp. PB-PSB1]